MSSAPRIALIHATSVAVDPIREAFARQWPDAEPVNLLDDSLSPDRAKAPEISAALAGRIGELASYARRLGSAGILFTCSAFGSAIEAAAREQDVPVLKPNEAMFDAAMEAGKRIAMIYTFEPARAGMEEEFREASAGRAGIESFMAAGAMDALRAGDAATHNRLVAETAASLSGFDAVMLAHFSTARAADAVRAATSIPVLTSPDAAAAKMKRLVAAG